MTHASQVIEMQRMQVDAFNSLGHAVLAAAGKLSELNLSASRLAMDSATETAQSLVSIKDAQAAVALSGAYAQPPLEQLMSYARNWIGIGNGMQAELTRVVEAQIAEGNRQVTALVKYATWDARGSQPSRTRSRTGS
jgi:phasin family protein